MSLDTRPNHNEHIFSEPWTTTRPERYWYLKDVPAILTEHAEYLCATCQHINLKSVFLDSVMYKFSDDDFISLGPFLRIERQVACNFCQLVATTIRIALDVGAVPGTDFDLEPERLLNAVWYLSPAAHHHEEYSIGYRVLLRYDVYDSISHLDSPTHPSHPFALRLISDAKRGGRGVSRSHIDITWIKSTLDLCDRNTALPARKLSYPIKVIDTLTNCVVELPDGAACVALSYPWGGVNQPGLLKQNKVLLGKLGGLLRIRNDAILLASNCRKAYLWVDSLCIARDD